MALGYLQIFFSILAIVSVIGQFLLYKDKLATVNSIFIFNALLGILFSWLVYSSMPTNFHTQKIISLVWGFLALSAIGLKTFRADSIQLSKVLLTISVIGGMIHLFM